MALDYAKHGGVYEAPRGPLTWAELAAVFEDAATRVESDGYCCVAIESVSVTQEHEDQALAFFKERFKPEGKRDLEPWWGNCNKPGSDELRISKLREAAALARSNMKEEKHGYTDPTS